MLTQKRNTKQKGVQKIKEPITLLGNIKSLIELSNVKMKNTALIIALFLTNSTYANDLPQANEETLAEIKEFCIEEAEIENIKAENLDSFVLKCINRELTYDGYRTIDKIPSA